MRVKAVAGQRVDALLQGERPQIDLLHRVAGLVEKEQIGIVPGNEPAKK